MKISLDWIKSWLPLEANSPSGIDKISSALTACGLEVEGIEEVVAVPGGLAGMVVGKVLSCEQHPGADRLKLTRVDVGEDQALAIVCGAPNVAVGQYVVVATVGAVCHPSEGEPFKIKKGKIRGEVSMGMLCAEDELGLGAGHDGILVLENEGLKAGTPAAIALGLESDHVIEIGLTPNRTDAMSHYGVARDLRAALRFGDGQSDQDKALPALKRAAGVASSAGATNAVAELSDAACPIKVEVQAPDGAPAYLGVLLEGVQVGPSPEWLTRRLRAIGLEPRNIVVDATNYVLHDLGQPLHAFDADRIEGEEIIVRRATEKEAFKGLDGNDYELSAHDLVIADKKVPLCLAGVWGGEKSGVTDSTRRVFLESAWFEPVTVRKTARRHGLSTDASFRFERGVDPNITRQGLESAVALLVKYASAKVVGGLSTSIGALPAGAEVKLGWRYMDTLIGADLDRSRVRNILESLDIEVAGENADGLALKVPAYRRDVTRPADVVEEILRIHGYDHIPFPTGMRVAMQTPPIPDVEAMQREISTLLVGRGATEVMSNSLSKLAYSGLAKDDSLDPAREIRLVNPLSNDTALMRQTLLYQGLEVVARGKNHQGGDLRLFEFGKGYFRNASTEKDQQATFSEPRFLGLWATGNAAHPAWNQNGSIATLYALKGEVEAILARMGVDVKSVMPLEASGIFSEGVQIKTRGAGSIRVGQVAPALAREFSIDLPVFWAELPWDSLCEAGGRSKTKSSALPRFPWVRRDLSLDIPSGVGFSQIEKVIRTSTGKLLRSVQLFDVYEADDSTSYAVAITLQDSEKTLNDKAIDKTMQRVLDQLEKQLSVRIRA
jgi:phenylalanyl-tRNA synthetase beta chain